MGEAMTGFLRSLVDRYQGHLERQRNRPFLRATMGACALVAFADGKVTLPERARVDQILETLEALKVFDPHEGVNMFNDFIDAIGQSPRKGRQRAVKAVIAVANDPEAADLMVRICCAVSESKGEKALTDQIEIVQLCSLLGVEPRNLGLYAESEGDDLLESLGPREPSDDPRQRRA